MIKANNPKLNSWVEVSKDSDFPIQNLPFGVFKTNHSNPRVCSRIGDYIVDLYALANLGLLKGIQIKKKNFRNKTINKLIGQGRKKTSALRQRLSDILNKEKNKWQGIEYKDDFLIPVSAVEMLLPIEIGDYTDFYSSIEHATNVGIMFRDPENALLPNWKHIPVGYHGRASSVIVSDTPIHRPKGQMLPKGADQPVFGPCRLLDFELEMAFVVGKSTKLGKAVPIQKAEKYIFGMMLFNDWSARDIQKWEYVPLGPFLGKNFASTLSPWIVTMEALEPFRVPGPKQDPEVLPYLKYDGEKNYDIQLEVSIQPDKSTAKVVSQSNFKYMYWNMAQQLAHHTVNGCNIKIGDLCASGTISGPTPDSYGSLLEISWAGSKTIDMPDGSERKFLKDGDTVILRGWAEKDGVRVGFGEASGKILPAKDK